MLGIGSAETGFIDEAQETWVYDGKSTDYHDSMNAKKFNAWLERVLPILKTYSDKICLVLDNAKYHCVKTDGTPGSQSKVGEMKQWILDQGLELPAHPIKKNLWPMIKNITKETPYLKSDDIIKAHESVPLHLPPYHCEVHNCFAKFVHEGKIMEFREYFCHSDFT